MIVFIITVVVTLLLVFILYKGYIYHLSKSPEYTRLKLAKNFNHNLEESIRFIEETYIFQVRRGDWSEKYFAKVRLKEDDYYDYKYINEKGEIGTSLYGWDNYEEAKEQVNKIKEKLAQAHLGTLL